MTGVLVQFLKNRLYAFCVIATAIFLHEMFFVNNSRVYTLSLLLSESYREVNVLRFMYFTLQLIRFIYLCKTCLHTVRDRRILFLFRPNISVVQHSLCSLYANCRILTFKRHHVHIISNSLVVRCQKSFPTKISVFCHSNRCVTRYTNISCCCYAYIAITC